DAAEARAASSKGWTESHPSGVVRWGALLVLIVTLPLNAMLLASAFKPELQWPRPIAAVYGWIEPFRIVNGYGLFRVMTKTRPEIEVEGSADGVVWLPYEFKWKPGDVNQAPRWVAPHQPRLDWQMWFAALGTYADNRWFVAFAEALLENRREVTSLLARNPFRVAPPQYVRATLYGYRFTTEAEHAQTGAWWHREPQGEYLPVVSLHHE
ncbi:MAG: lipase maturation factor family protein, partial [Verrucomicrobiota bacterium]|nr:lipase maturation factor family protein [Verrucomicrobiota bacterium]